jgi:rRNA maturation endonuclease Nob1
VPIRQRVRCPACDAELVRKPGGRCPGCGTAVGEHVQAVRAREERIERIVAVIGTVLVVGVLALTSGLGLVEGALAYAGAGGVMFYLARKTF